jgi:hypothetical protein
MYFKLTDAIAAADSDAALEALRRQVRSTEMHPVERRAVERVLRSRADTLRLLDNEVPGPSPQRAD